MFYVYIRESEDGLHFYVGCTKELRGRLTKHNAGEAPPYAQIPALAVEDLHCFQ